MTRPLSVRRREVRTAILEAIGLVSLIGAAFLIAALAHVSVWG
jgi:hypothetical protein